MTNDYFSKIFEIINYFSCARNKSLILSKLNKNLNTNLDNLDWELLLISDKSEKDREKKDEENTNLSIRILNYLLNDKIIKDTYKNIIKLEEREILNVNIFQQNLELNKIIKRILLLDEVIKLNIENIVQNSIQKYNNAELCCICLTNIKNCAYIHCGHMCICEECMNNNKYKKWKNKCPICKKKGTIIKIWR